MDNRTTGRAAKRQKRSRSMSVARGSKTTLTKDDVAKIARQVVLKSAETKSPINRVLLNLFAPNCYAINLNYFISQGAAAYQVTGEKVFLKNFRIKVTFDNIFDANTTSNTNQLRCFVIQTKKDLTTTNTIITNSDVFRSDGSSSQNEPAKTSHIDLHKVSLVSEDHYEIVSPQFSNQIISKSFDMVIQINKTKYFDQDNSGRFKDGDYYFIVASQRYGDVGTNINTAFQIQWSVNCKDD